MNFVVSWISVEILILKVMIGASITPIISYELLVSNGEDVFRHKGFVIDVIDRIRNIYLSKEIAYFPEAFAPF